MTEREKLNEIFNQAYELGSRHGEQKQEIYRKIDGYFAQQMADKLKDTSFVKDARMLHDAQKAADEYREQVIAKDKQIAELIETVDKLTDDNGSLVADMAEADKKIELITEQNLSYEKAIEERNEFISRLQDEKDAADLQISRLEKKLAETEALLRPEYSDIHFPITPIIKRESKGDSVSNSQAKQHSKEVFVKYEEFDKEVGGNVEYAKKFDSISQACRFVSERLGGVNSADTIHSSYTKQRQRGVEENFKGYRLERCE